MAEKESGVRKKKEVPLVTWQQKRPRDGVLDGQPYTWEAIRENPDKPQQIQGWRRAPRKIEAETPGVSPTYPTSRPPIEREIPMGGIPRGDRDLDDENIQQ